MNISAAKAKIGLSATATLTSTSVSGTARIGEADSIITLADADVAYSVTAVIANPSSFVIDLTNGDTTGSDAWVAGTAQVETATAAGTITTAGNATVIVTAAGLTGSPVTVTFAVALNDTASQWAAKARTALAANAFIAGMFTIGGTTTAIALTRKPVATFTVGDDTINIYPANDGTLNIALADDTSAGITEAATSANTTAGVATEGCTIYDGDGNDLEGNVIPSFATLRGIRIESESGVSDATGTIIVTGNPYLPDNIETGSSLGIFYPEGTIGGYSTTFEPDGNACLITLTVLGKTA